LKIELDRRFKNKAKGLFGKYEFEVGILENKAHKKALSKSKGLKDFHGGPARKIGAKPKLTVEEISRFFRKRGGKFNYLTTPFKNRSSDIVNFAKEFFKFAFGKSEKQRALNYLQAIVRNPILRGDYGPNKRSTIRTKGFNRFGIDTGQLFQNIKARVKINRV
jgi:hypothetical protein